MELEQLIVLLKSHQNLAEIARATGLGYQHLHKIKRGERRKLQLPTMIKLQHYFREFNRTDFSLPPIGDAMPTVEDRGGDV